MNTSKSRTAPSCVSSHLASPLSAARCVSGMYFLNKLKAERKRRKLTRTWCTPSGVLPSIAAAKFAFQCVRHEVPMIAIASSTVADSVRTNGGALVQMGDAMRAPFLGACLRGTGARFTRA